ncbi:SPOCS domain-containing protein [Halanaerobaculum tunisiense]
MNDSLQNDKSFELVTVDDNLKSLPPKTTYKEFIKEKTMAMPKENTTIKKLAKILINPKITSYKTTHTSQGPKVIIQGRIIEKMFYIAQNKTQTIQTAKFNFPFYTFITLPVQLKLGDIKIKVEDTIVQLINKQEINQCILLCTCVIPKKSDF